MNKLEADYIISETIRVFSTSGAQREKYASLPKISNEDFVELHNGFLTPLAIKINSKVFCKDIEQYDHEFVQWGKRFTHLPRLGVALVNSTGLLLGSEDPINGSLYEYNENFPETPLFESDCTTHTELMDLTSLNPLHVLSGHYMRSNIFKWDNTAMFTPHIDTVLPTPWFRLWGTTNPEFVKVNYFNTKTNTYETITDIEPGRIYLIDTSLVHDAHSTGLNYQFFLSTAPSSVELLKMLKL